VAHCDAVLNGGWVHSIDWLKVSGMNF